MRKQLENRKKLMADIEDRQLERDAQIKREILVRRMMIIEKARYKKWSERDSTKALNRAVHKMEVPTIFTILQYKIVFVFFFLLCFSKFVGYFSKK